MRIRDRIATVAMLAAGGLLASVASAGAAVSGSNDPNFPASGLGIYSSASYTHAVGPTQGGFGNSALAGFPTQASPALYGILTSGDAELADTPNNDGGDGDNLGIDDPARGDANDSITLRFNFDVAGSNCLNFDYKFLSEEFPEFVDKGFNDGFVAELDATNWKTENQDIIAPLDFAAGYGDKVSVDTVGPTVVTPANAGGTTYDAATGILTAKTPVTDGAHSLYLSVFDAGDHIYDSAVFFDRLHFTNEPASTCRSPDVFGGAVGTSVKGKFKVKGKNLLVPINCLLPEGATDPCVGKVVVTANAPKGGASAAKKVTLAKGSYSVEPGQKGKARAKMSKKGKKLVKRRGKLKAKVRVTNTVNGVTKGFKVKF